MDRVAKLPAAEGARDRLLFALHDDTATQAGRAAAVESDVGLVVAVMRHANRVPRSSVATVPRALHAMTPRELEVIALGVPTYGLFEHMPGWKVAPQQVRMHALAVARTVDMVAHEIEHPLRGELVIAALLHDIGKVVLAEADPAYREEILDAGGSPDEWSRAERLRHGVDHATVGAVLLERWRIPKVITRAIAQHHAPDAVGEAGVLRLGDMLAHYERGTPVRACEIEQAAAQLGLSGSRLRSILHRLPDHRETRRAESESPLSGREQEVLRGLAAAKVYKEIAVDLGIGASTVRTHLHNAYAKLGVADRAQAVLVASGEGWI